MKTLCALVSVVAVLVSFAMGAVAQDKPAPEPKQQTVYTEKAGTLTATVQAIDLEKRIVTVKGGPKDQEIDIKVDEKVKNLSSLKKGDKVKLQYYASVAYRIAKPGEVTEPVETVEVKRMTGQARMVTMTATLHDIDKNTNNIVLKGPGGNLVGVKVKDPSKLEDVKVGDQLVISYTEALAVSVEKVK